MGCDGGTADTPTLSGSAAPEQPDSTADWDQCRRADREGPSLRKGKDRAGGSAGAVSWGVRKNQAGAAGKLSPSSGVTYPLAAHPAEQVSHAEQVREADPPALTTH